MEYRADNSRPSNRVWYFIDYRHTIDAIKWRLYTIDKDVQGITQATTAKKEYLCSFCRAEWSQMEVLDDVSPEGYFLCHRCQNVLTCQLDRHSGGCEQSTRSNEQLKFISDLLRKIDAVHISNCDFDQALAKAKPVVRNTTHQVAMTTAVDLGANRPMVVKGSTNTGPQSISVNISTTEGVSEAEKAAEAARKGKLAAQNTLPSWMLNSAVTGKSFAGASAGRLAAVENDLGVDNDSNRTVVDSRAFAKMDHIFESLKSKQAAQKIQSESEDEDEDEDGDEDEDEDDFEDVLATVNNSTLRN